MTKKEFIKWKIAIVKAYFNNKKNIKELGNPEKYRHKHPFPSKDNEDLWKDWLDTHNPPDSLFNYRDFNLSGVGHVTIWMETNCPLDPHFHVVNDDGTFDAIFRMDSPKYYEDHGYESDKLTLDQLDELMEFLNYYNRKIHITNWYYLRTTWSREPYRKGKLPKRMECPPYWLLACPDDQLAEWIPYK